MAHKDVPCALTNGSNITAAASHHNDIHYIGIFFLMICSPVIKRYAKLDHLDDMVLVLPANCHMEEIVH
jgi:hypothetical protein